MRVSGRAQRALRAILERLVELTLFLFLTTRIGLLMEGVGDESRVEDDCFGVGRVDETERVVEVSGEEDVMGNVV